MILLPGPKGVRLCRPLKIFRLPRLAWLRRRHERVLFPLTTRRAHTPVTVSVARARRVDDPQIAVLAGRDKPNVGLHDLRHIGASNYGKIHLRAYKVHKLPRYGSNPIGRNAHAARPSRRCSLLPPHFKSIRTCFSLNP